MYIQKKPVWIGLFRHSTYWQRQLYNTHYFKFRTCNTIPLKIQRLGSWHSSDPALDYWSTLQLNHFLQSFQQERYSPCKCTAFKLICQRGKHLDTRFYSYTVTWQCQWMIHPPLRIYAYIATRMWARCYTSFRARFRRRWQQLSNIWPRSTSSCLSPPDG